MRNEYPAITASRCVALFDRSAAVRRQQYMLFGASVYALAVDPEQDEDAFAASFDSACRPWENGHMRAIPGSSISLNGLMAMGFEPALEDALGWEDPEEYADRVDKDADADVTAIWLADAERKLESESAAIDEVDSATNSDELSMPIQHGSASVETRKVKRQFSDAKNSEQHDRTWRSRTNGRKAGLSWKHLSHSPKQWGRHPRRLQREPAIDGCWYAEQFLGEPEFTDELSFTHCVDWVMGERQFRGHMDEVIRRITRIALDRAPGGADEARGCVGSAA